MRIFTENQKFTQPLVYIGFSLALIVVSVSIFKDWNTVVTASFSEKIGLLSGLIMQMIGKDTHANFELMNEAMKKRVEEISR